MHINSIYIPCVPVVICVLVSQFVFSLWVSRSSFIFPLSQCPGRHLCPGVPVCNFYSNNPCVSVVNYISRLCPRRPRCSCVPASRSSFIFPVVICVRVSQSVIFLWGSWSSFIFPLCRSSFVSRSVIYLWVFFLFSFFLVFYIFSVFFSSLFFSVTMKYISPNLCFLT